MKIKKNLTIFSLILGVMLLVGMMGMVSAATILPMGGLAKDDNTNFGSSANEALGVDISLTLNQLFAGDGFQYEYKVLNGGTYNGASPAMAVINLADGRHIVLFPGWGSRTGTHTLKFSDTVASDTGGNNYVDFSLQPNGFGAWLYGSGPTYGDFAFVKGATGLITGNEIVTRVAIQHQAANTREVDQIVSMLINGVTYLPDTQAPTISDPTVDPQYPRTTTNPVTICADVTDDFGVSNVRLDCTSSPLYHTATSYSMSGIGNKYCTGIWFSDWRDAETVSCTITAIDNNGNSDTKNVPQFTYDGANPVASFTCTPLSGTEPLMVTCTSTSTDSVDSDLDHVWTFVGGVPSSSTTKNPTVSFSQQGLYNVSLTVTDNVGNFKTETKTNYITVTDTKPTANAGPDQTIVEGNIVHFNGSGSTGYDQPLSYAWTFANGSVIGIGVNPEIYFSQQGTFIVTLTVTDKDYSTSTDNVTIIVTDTAPVVDFSCTPNPVNENSTVTCTSSSTAYDTPMTYSWTTSPSYGTGSESTFSFTPTNDGTVIVTLTVTDGDGTIRSLSKDVNVNNVAPVFVNLPASSEGAVYKTWTFDVDATDPADVLTYSLVSALTWASINPDTGVITFTPGLYNNGSYVLTVRVSDDDTSIDSTLNVKVYDYQINLDVGWNLISIPLVPENDNTSISSVFGGEILANADIVWAYQNGQWKYNQKSSSNGTWSTLTSRVLDILPGYGYYIKIAEGMTVYKNGKRMYGNEGFTVPKPPVVTLTPSWNLIGHYGMETLLKSNALTTLGGRDSTLLDKDGHSVLTTSPTNGYWLFVTGTGNLDYAPSDKAYP